MSLKNKLQRFKNHLTEAKPDEGKRKRTDDSGDIAPHAIPFAEKWADLQMQAFELDGEYIMVREVRYPVSQSHGRYTFQQLHDIMAAWEQSGLSHPLSAARQPAEELLFFDTETTGLHGGTGNTIFLLGYSRFEENTVVVRQHFLASPDAEVALYQSFLSDVNEANHLVTYNGKAFDWPQVKTRHTLLRESVPQLPVFGHYDLLHGARRLWRHDLESCRLSMIEPEKLGIVRTDDVPGYLAPMLYFDYLRTRDPDTIQGVLRHNEIDVLTLITLYIHISKLLLDHITPGTATHEEQFAIARWFEALGLDGEAAVAYQIIAESGHSLRGKAKIALGHQYKKAKQWQQALRIWEECIDELPHVPEEVYIETAKIHEHQSKDYEKALYYTLQAYERWKKKGALLRQRSKTEETAYRKRIERLEQQIDRL